jgi:hypothetical protein
VSEPAWRLDIIYVDTPSGEAAENSSSYNLSIFSSGANSEGAKVIAITSGNSSLSIGELWSDIDKLDEDVKAPPLRATRDVLVHGRGSAASAKRAGGRSRHEGKKALMKDASGTSNVASISRGGSSVKKEASRKLSAPPGGISSHIVFCR